MGSPLSRSTDAKSFRVYLLVDREGLEEGTVPRCDAGAASHCLHVARSMSSMRGTAGAQGLLDAELLE